MRERIEDNDLDGTKLHAYREWIETETDRQRVRQTNIQR